MNKEFSISKKDLMELIKESVEAVLDERNERQKVDLHQFMLGILTMKLGLKARTAQKIAGALEDEIKAGNFSVLTMSDGTKFSKQQESGIGLEEQINDMKDPIFRLVRILNIYMDALKNKKEQIDPIIRQKIENLENEIKPMLGDSFLQAK